MKEETGQATEQPEAPDLEPTTATSDKPVKKESAYHREKRKKAAEKEKRRAKKMIRDGEHTWDDYRKIKKDWGVTLSKVASGIAIGTAIAEREKEVGLLNEIKELAIKLRNLNIRFENETKTYMKYSGVVKSGDETEHFNAMHSITNILEPMLEIFLVDYGDVSAKIEAMTKRVRTREEEAKAAAEASSEEVNADTEESVEETE